MKRLLVSFLLAFAGIAIAQDSARQLARILAEKGVLTNDELVNIERAEANDAVRLLSAALYQKGILTQAEMARVSGPATVAPGEVRFVPVVATTTTPAVHTAQPQSTTRQTAEIPAVTSASHFPVQIYGTVLWNAFYNTAGTNIEDIPLLGTKRGTDPFENFGMTARQTRFGLRYQGPEVMGGGKLSGNVELDLFGGKAPLGNGVSMDLVRLRLAYGRVDWHDFSIEAGQDWAVFSPLNPTSLASFAIPSMSASGNPWIRSPQFRFDWRSDAAKPTRVLLQLAALDPNVGDNVTTTVVDSRAPGIGERGRGPAVESRLAVIGKIGDRDATVGVSGHYGRGDNVGVVGGVTVGRPVDSWGVNLDYTLPLDKHFALSGEAFVGRALGLFSVAAGQSVLPLGTPGEHGVLGRGGWVQGQINFNSKWQMNLAYGLESDKGRNLRTGDRAKNQTYMANLMYKLTPHITWAWEWRRFLTDYRNQQAVNAIGDTANMAIAYIF
ncbi:MAG TPA: hypothetical protein VEU96_00210 [Bryobacteraceae bacterium]|nr:hypothetical protein [Bryobacteraceae bacterium]